MMGTMPRTCLRTFASVSWVGSRRRPPTSREAMADAAARAAASAPLDFPLGNQERSSIVEQRAKRHVEDNTGGQAAGGAGGNGGAVLARVPTNRSKERGVPLDDPPLAHQPVLDERVACDEVFGGLTGVEDAHGAFGWVAQGSRCQGETAREEVVEVRAVGGEVHHELGHRVGGHFVECDKLHRFRVSFLRGARHTTARLRVAAHLHPLGAPLGAFPSMLTKSAVAVEVSSLSAPGHNLSHRRRRHDAASNRSRQAHHSAVFLRDVDLHTAIADAPWIAVLATVALGLASGAVSGRGALRTAVALILAVAAWSVPFLVPASLPVYRFLLALTAMLAVFRAIDRAREARPLPLLHRLWAVTSPFETRAVVKTQRRLDGRLLAAAIGYGLLSAAGFELALTYANRLEGPAHYAVRWLGGAVFAYASIDAVATLLRFFYRAIGLELPPLHRTPILSKSLQEFWGERWNLVVRDWFHRHCFMPFARRRLALLGIAAAFAASTLLHMTLAAVVVGPEAVAMAGGFFVAQGVLTLIERRIGLDSLPTALQHVWTVACVLGTSPLFVEPVLRGFG